MYFTIWRLFAKKTLQKLKKINKMKNENKNKNVILYCRVSYNNQSDLFIDKDEQMNRLLRFCNLYGYNVVKVFTDYNTQTNKNNQQLQNMMDYAKNNVESVSAILCESFDRISRNCEETIEIMIDYCNIGMEIISMKQIINYKNNSNEQ